MTDKIISMSEKANDGRMRTPEDALKDALTLIGKHGAYEKGKKLLILCVDDTDGGYGVSFSQAGMKMSECVTLCDIGKNIFKSEMGY